MTRTAFDTLPDKWTVSLVPNEDTETNSPVLLLKCLDATVIS